MVCWINVVFILLLWFFDVQYYIRIISTVILAKILKRRKITDELCTYGICFTQDLDLVCRHMNNARYVRELDFARFNFFVATGLYNGMLKHKTDAVQAATNIRYRRVIPLFYFYKVTTKMIYWDDRSVYLEQRFVTMDGFVRAAILSKATAHKAVMEEMIQALNPGPKPEPSADLDLWIKSMDASSERLNPKKKD